MESELSATLQILEHKFVEDDVVKFEGQIQVLLNPAHPVFDLIVHLSFIDLGLAAVIREAVVQFLVLCLSQLLFDLKFLLVPLRHNFFPLHRPIQVLLPLD